MKGGRKVSGGASLPNEHFLHFSPSLPTALVGYGLRTHFTLLPRDEVRTPYLVELGGRGRGRKGNAFRRLSRRHYRNEVAAKWLFLSSYLQKLLFSLIYPRSLAFSRGNALLSSFGTRFSLLSPVCFLWNRFPVFPPLTTSSLFTGS